MASLRRPLVAVAASLTETVGTALNRTQQGAVAQLNQQTRGAAHNAGIGVDVPHGNVDKAWKALTRKLKVEGFVAATQSRQHFVKPSERRKVARAEAQKRFRQQEFDNMLQWIMRRRSRGF